MTLYWWTFLQITLHELTLFFWRNPSGIHLPEAKWSDTDRRIIGRTIINISQKCLKTFKLMNHLLTCFQAIRQKLYMDTSSCSKQDADWINLLSKMSQDIARIGNAVHCHSWLSGKKDCHEFRFSIVRIVISVSIVTSLQDCLVSQGR